MMARTKLAVKVVERQEDHDKREFDGIWTMEIFSEVSVSDLILFPLIIKKGHYFTHQKKLFVSMIQFY